MGGAAGGLHLGQGCTDAGQPVDGCCAVLSHGGHQTDVIDLVAAVHGVLDELLDAAVGDAQGCLVRGAGCVHATGGLQAVAAHAGHFLHHDDRGPVFGGLGCGGQAGAAGAHHHHVAVQGFLGAFGVLGGSGSHLKLGHVDAAALQRSPDSLLDGIAGDGAPGNAVHCQALGIHNHAGEFFHCHRTDALGLVLLHHVDGINLLAVGGHLHHHVALDALTGAGQNLLLCCAAAGCCALGRGALAPGQQHHRCHGCREDAQPFTGMFHDGNLLHFVSCQAGIATFFTNHCSKRCTINKIHFIYAANSF